MVSLRHLLFFLMMTFSILRLSGQVVINEVFAGPSPHPNDNSSQPGTNANSLYSIDLSNQPPYNREFIELYNSHPCDTIDISCYTLGSNANSSASGSNWGAFTFPAGTKIPPLGFLLIGGNYSPSMVIDFDITWYRQNTFNVQYLTGSPNRWFLRDQWGWVALYDPQGNPVDAVYWNSAPGNAFSLSVEQEYQQPIVNTLGCTGTLTLSAAANIPGITYVGNINSGSNTSFQRIQDGSPVWHPTPVPVTPRGPNGIPVSPPLLTYAVTPDYCGQQNGTIQLHITAGGTQPYTLYWNGSTTPGDSVLVQLTAGTYTIEVRDAYNCLFTRDTITVPSAPGPAIHLLSVVDETCSAGNGTIIVNVTGGLPPYSYAWNTNPVITGGSLVGIPAGTYHLTVTDVNGCLSDRSVTINNHAEPTVTATLLSPDSCGYGIGRVMALVTGDHPPYQYLWNTLPAQTTPMAVNLPAGSYSVTVTDGVCTVVTTIVVPLIPGPTADFLASPTVVYVENALVQFTDMSSGPVSAWHWDFGDGSTTTQQNPSHLYFKTGTYQVTLTVTDNIGCEGSASKSIRVKDITTIFFPNAFTPDGDGLNDLFMPKGSDIYNYTLIIFDRWGRELFRSTEPAAGWDGTSHGKPLPDGVYVWLATFTHDYGDYVERDLILRGTVTLIR